MTIYSFSTPSDTAATPLSIRITMLVVKTTQLPNFQSLCRQLAIDAKFTQLYLKTSGGELNVDIKMQYQPTGNMLVLSGRRLMEHVSSTMENVMGGKRRVLSGTTSTSATTYPIIAFDDLYLLGGGSGSTTCRIPCVLDVICPPIATVKALYPSLAYTLRLDFSLNLTSLPADIFFNLNNGLGVSLNYDFAEFLQASVGVVNVKPSQVKYSINIGLLMNDAKVMNDVINAVGKTDVVFRITGNPTHSLFSSLFYKMSLTSKVKASTNLTADGAAPSWVFPLYSSGNDRKGSWKLLSTTANLMKITIDFPIPYPLPSK